MPTGTCHGGPKDGDLFSFPGPRFQVEQFTPPPASYKPAAFRLDSPVKLKRGWYILTRGNWHWMGWES